MAWTTNYSPVTNRQINTISADGLAKTYQMNLPNWGDMTFTDKDGNQSTWSLQQFHHHSPSEHFYDGESRRLEIHFVHYSKVGTQTSADALSVLSVSFEANSNGADNEWLEYFTDDGEVKLN